jgi:FdrA protein
MTDPRPTSATPSRPNPLLTAPVRVINVGLQGFADELASQGVPVTHVDWAPPAGGDPRLAALLAKLGA